MGHHRPGVRVVRPPAAGRDPAGTIGLELEFQFDLLGTGRGDLTRNGLAIANKLQPGKRPDAFRGRHHLDRAAVAGQVDFLAHLPPLDLQVNHRTSAGKRLTAPHSLAPIVKGKLLAIAQLGIRARAAQNAAIGHLVGAADNRQLLAHVEPAVVAPLGRTNLLALPNPAHLTGVCVPQDDVGRVLKIGQRHVRHNDQPALFFALLSPIGHQRIHRAADPILIGPAGTHRRDQILEAEQADVPKHVLPILLTDPNQVIVAAGRCQAAGKLLPRGKQPTPLAGQQMHHIEVLAFGL